MVEPLNLRPEIKSQATPVLCQGGLDVTDNNHISSDLQQGFFGPGACDHIADLIFRSRFKDDFDASCSTEEGTRVRVVKSFSEAPPYHEIFHITVADDDRFLVDVFVTEHAVETLLSLKTKYDRTVARRNFLAEEDEILAREERDLDCHIEACVMALCDGEAA